MRWRTVFNAWLLAVMLLNLSGAATVWHQRAHVVATRIVTVDADASEGHGHSHDEPIPTPLPGNHGDCPTCFALMHVAATTVDLNAAVVPETPVVRATAMPVSGEHIHDLIHLPDGRGPPIC